jgi:hypothetical protein
MAGEEREYSDRNAQTFTLVRRVTAGMAVGFLAGIPQVLAAQAVALALGRRERADIAPRFVQRAAEHLGQSLSRPARWTLALVFHFGYAVWWGGAYAATIEALGVRRVPPALGGGLLGAVIYTLAFSRIGMGTATRAERHPERRGLRDWIVQATSVLSFSLIVAYGYRGLRERR